MHHPLQLWFTNMTGSRGIGGKAWVATKAREKKGQWVLSHVPKIGNQNT